MHRMKMIRSVMQYQAGMFLLLTLCGCGAGPAILTGPYPGISVSPSISGKAHGGQFPISSAVIQLYAVGMTGYGSPAKPLLPTTGPELVKTNANGMFTITGLYTCPANAYVYITASGGSPFPSSPSIVNKAMSLMAYLGPCSGLSAATFVNIDEVTTVASVWALSHFASAVYGTTLYDQPGSNPIVSTVPPAVSFGAPSTNAQGLANAYQVTQDLVNLAAGTSPGSNSSNNLTNVETWQINLIANILASCVNSDGTTDCTSLSSAVTPSGQSGSADTLQAALYMALNPMNNVTAIFGLASPNCCFQPASSAVNDFTIGMAFAGTTNNPLVAPFWVAIDPYGNAYVTNVGSGTADVSGAPCNGGCVEELDPAGNFLGQPINSYVMTGGTVHTVAQSTTNAIEVAIDTTGNAWVPDRTNNYIYSIGASTAAGVANSGTATGYTAKPSSSSVSPTAIAVDGSNNIWFGSNAASGKLVGLLAVNSYANPVSGGALGGGSSASPISIALDASSSSLGGPFIYSSNNAGCPSTSLGGSSTTVAGETGVFYSRAAGSGTAGAATAAGTLADSNCGATSASTTLLSPNTIGSEQVYFTSGENGLAVDHHNNVWIANSNYVTSDANSTYRRSITLLTPSYVSNGSGGANGTYSYSTFTSSSLTTPYMISIDGGGNAWVSNQGGALTALSPTGSSLGGTTGFSGGTYIAGSTTIGRYPTGGSYRGIAVDGSGNVWLANRGTNTVIVLVGAAVPVVTPLSMGIRNNALGIAP